MTRPRLLDLYSCAGGAAVGYHRAGFDVVGVDIAFQKNYPYEFHQADALAYVTEHGREFDAIHASPPCQHYSTLTRGNRGRGETRDHPDLVRTSQRSRGEDPGLVDALLAADAAWEAANVAMQTFGGYSYDAEYDVERKYREARLYQVAPISTNLVLSYVGEHVLGMPRSY